MEVIDSIFDVINEHSKSNSVMDTNSEKAINSIFNVINEHSK